MKKAMLILDKKPDDCMDCCLCYDCMGCMITGEEINWATGMCNNCPLCEIPDKADRSSNLCETTMDAVADGTVLENISLIEVKANANESI